METVQLGHTEINVPRIGFGCDPMGGHGWGEIDYADLKRAVHQAIDLGANLFDIADIYGIGRAESFLGECLEGKRHDAIVASKFGVRRTPDNSTTFFDNSPDWIRQAVEGSLRRLRTDYIDLYQVHNWDGRTPFEDIFGVLEKLKREGKIRCYGISNFGGSEMKSVVWPEAIASSQREFSLANRKNESGIFDDIVARGLTFMSWGSLGQGILSGKYKSRADFSESDRRTRDTYPNFYGPKLEHNLKIVAALSEIANGHSKTLAQCALRWILDYIPKSVTLVGIKSSKQLAANLGALGWSLQGSEVKALEEISRFNYE